MNDESKKYEQIEPSDELKDFVDSFWIHRSNFDNQVKIPIIPDSFFKIIFFVKEGKIINYFMTGFFTEKKDFEIPPFVTVFGCRLKILAPEYLINREVASILQDDIKLDFSYLNIENFDLVSFENTVKQWEKELLNLKPNKVISENKLKLSRLLDKIKGEMTASEVSNEIFWANRQINRYLNKYIGMPLKKYLNIQKVYSSYIPIREGKFFPEKNYYDQAHFIKEIKKHTGETPQKLHKEQNDRFIQLRDVKKK